MSEQLQLPVSNYKVGGYGFGEKIRRHVILSAKHLGDDVTLPGGSEVKAIGDGKVVYSKFHLGSKTKRNWGGLVIIKHKDFYSLYGHLKDLQVKKEEQVLKGQVVGFVADSLSAENGWWQKAHLHFAIYTGPWSNAVLPGWKRIEQFRTKFKYWHNPVEFITKYNNQT